MTSMIKTRQELAKLREQAEQGKQFKTREEAMNDFYQLIPEMQRTVTRSTLADFY